MNVRRDCVFDVGLHKGEDTDYYLAKGYRVIAFEADPDLIAHCRNRFSRAIDNGRLTIIEGAVANPGSPAAITFYKNLANSVWGTLVPNRAAHNAHVGAASKPIVVKTVNVADALAQFGVPFYIKVDIEGVDTAVIDAVANAAVAPPFISIESDKTDIDAVAAEIEKLVSIGYRRFLAVQQEVIPTTRISTRKLDGEPLRYVFEPEASGPFGPDLSGWLDTSQIMDRYRRIYRDYARWGDDSYVRRVLRGGVLDRIGKAIRYSLPGWYDTHARID
jgi:FkbM family methyltransferase